MMDGDRSDPFGDAGWRDEPSASERGDVVVRETHLSRKPNRGAGLVALGSLGVLTFMSVVYWTDAMGLGAALPASRSLVYGDGEYWRLFTTMGAHADLEHLLSNGIVLTVLAFLLYGYFGSGVYPASCVALGGLVTGLSISSYPAETRLVGASGLVYLMVAFWLTLYLLIERTQALHKRIVRAVGFGLIVLMPASIEPTVSYRTHAIGFAVGIAYGLFYFSRHRETLRGAERRETVF